ncbi:heterokaryon incompatibility protein-domain-containing protein, partial [Echria macrotheca]
MISWHERSCFRPDVSLVDSSPFCMSCGSLASLDDLDAGQAPPPPPIPSQRQAGLALSWPSSVTYSASFVSDDEDLTSQLVEIAASAASQSYDMDISYGMDIDDDATSDTEGTLTGDEGPHGDPVPKAWAKREREHMDELVGTDCIRILRLGKGKGTDPLHGVLQVRQLKYFPEYEALSYTWADANGNANRTKKLYLGSSWDITPITPNCEAALRSLRLPTKERYIWVDALCINHTRVQERSSQVQLMPVIYATAQRVLVYLGDDRPSVDIKSSRLKAGWNGWEDRWNEMDENLKRPYFFRSWIIQEIAMAKSALVTDGKSWRVWPIHNDLKETKTFLPWISHFDKRKYKTPNDLVQLVIDSWTSQASDPRDKVFALLGVISGAAADGLIADYSLSMEHVYTGFASFALQKLGAISLLKYAGGYEKSPGLPSWVPDWRQLSQDWAIMARIKLFHSRTEIEHLALSRNIALERTELLTRPWPPGPNTLGRSDIYIHSQTGALCVSGISLVELPSPLDLEPSKETFLVFKAEGFFIVAPITAKEGDVVFFLHGLNSPVILRSRGANIFSFVGMCYARIRRGISMHRKGIGQDRFDVLYLKARTRGLAVHIPKEWTHSKPQCNTLVRDAARELLEAQAGAYDVEQESSLEAIGKEAERTWTYVLQTNLPVVLMMPDLSPKDLVAPVPHLLGELKEAVGNLVQMWAETVAYLEA